MTPQQFARSAMLLLAASLFGMAALPARAQGLLPAKPKGLTAYCADSRTPAGNPREIRIAEYAVVLLSNSIRRDGSNRVVAKATVLAKTGDYPHSVYPVIGSDGDDVLLQCVNPLDSAATLGLPDVVMETRGLNEANDLLYRLKAITEESGILRKAKDAPALPSFILFAKDTFQFVSALERRPVLERWLRNYRGLQQDPAFLIDVPYDVTLTSSFASMVHVLKRVQPPPSNSPPADVAAATPPVSPAPMSGPVGRRVALVLGNSSYRHMPSLQNPKNDAADIESALKALNFETVLATDLDRAGMNAAIERFSRLVPGASVAVVYYSGHGMQFAGKNYLLPTDASLESAADVNRYRLLPIDDVVEVLSSADGLQLIVLDACRNNPVEKDFKNKVASVPGGNRDVASTRGFTRMDARSGLIITYATAPNDVAADGVGRNSPFTQAFLKNIAAPDKDIRLVLFDIQEEVYSSSGKRQLPEISSLYVGPPVRFKPSQK